MGRDPIYIVALVIAALVGKGCYDKKQQELGAVKLLLSQTTAQRDTAKRTADSALLAFRIDTVRLTKTIVRRDTVLRTIDRFLHDTIPVPVEIVKEIIRADSQVINACQTALSTCEVRMAAMQDNLDGANKQINLLKHQQPSLVTKAKTVGFWMGIGIFLRSVIK